MRHQYNRQTIDRLYRVHLWLQSVCDSERVWSGSPTEIPDRICPYMSDRIKYRTIQKLADLGALKLAQETELPKTWTVEQYDFLALVPAEDNKDSWAAFFIATRDNLKPYLKGNK